MLFALNFSCQCYGLFKTFYGFLVFCRERIIPESFSSLVEIIDLNIILNLIFFLVDFRILGYGQSFFIESSGIIRLPCVPVEEAQFYQRFDFGSCIFVFSEKR